MRLLNTRTLAFEQFFGHRPPYAILSHTWEGEEVSHQDVRDRIPSLESRQGYRKIQQWCRIAAEQRFEWAWVDTCCIDKTNNAELTESINSMFRWYQQAAACFVYLSDLPVDGELKTNLPNCRWFRRGWTLQELLAPSKVQFYDQAWNLRGTKDGFIFRLESITGIPANVLTGHASIRQISIADRMSWAANRETTRSEDVAYCLLGIFDVNMPMIYGEGENAFRRLQEEIIRKSNDMTIFAW
ncbi:heterokaryon incompatibility protein-domain-containing protein, partial [Apiosordaria backusii]